MGLNGGQTLALLHLPYDPGDCLTERFSQHGATGLADGRQAYASPFLRTVLPQLAHQSAVRHEYEIHVPGLALAIPELTRAHAQMLLAVPMERLGPCPALTIGLEDAMHLPIRAIRDQDFRWLIITLLLPEHHNPHRVVDTRDTNALGEEPLHLPIDDGFAPTERT